MGPRIVLVGDEALEGRVRVAVPELNGNLERWSGDATELYIRRRVDELMSSGPEVVAFGSDLPPDAALELAADLDRRHPDVEVVIFAEPTPQLWERAARAGVRELVSLRAGEEELGIAVRRAMSAADDRRARRQVEPPAEDGDGMIMVVRSPKGGSGKTMVATNLAVLLAQRAPGEVVVVDLDLQFGDMANAFGIEPSYTIADATANVDLNPTSLKTLLSRHKSGVYALCAPPLPDDADPITGDDVTAMLTLLRLAFRYVIVDTAAGIDVRALAALRQATDVVLLCSMDVSSVRAIRKDIEGMRSHGLTDLRDHVVLNRANSRVGLEVRDIEATIGRKVDVHIPSCRSVPLHMNCGVPVVDAEPSSPVSRQLQVLADRFARRPATSTTRAWRKRR